ncbi:MAG: hypothetical protein LC808_38360 [Actinobacteria bacterium]|nr:hypothetical protein [Actinomycetota bacterium]
MTGVLSERSVAKAQGLFNVLGGLWPLVSLRSFEWVYGKKRDILLQKTVGGLLFSIGCVQLASAGSEEEIRVARRLGIATAGTLLAIDLAYIPRGQMRWTYWQDALCELGWIAAWVRPKESPRV